MTRNRHVRLIGALCILGLLNAACTVGPTYRRPATAADESSTYARTPEDTEQLVFGEFNCWWRQKNDPIMNKYVDTLLKENLELKAAAARQHPDRLPAQLIDRRPDLRASELRMAAEVDQIGVAEADLYPDLTLSGNIGYQGNEPAYLVTARTAWNNRIALILALGGDWLKRPPDLAPVSSPTRESDL
ncbi:MAG: TolC family protein [Desulfobacterales bacterium]|nr:TolC family protein [Desulfobacterales bacterium]